MSPARAEVLAVVRITAQTETVQAACACRFPAWRGHPVSTRGYIRFVASGQSKDSYSHCDSMPYGLGITVLHWLRRASRDRRRWHEGRRPRRIPRPRDGTDETPRRPGRAMGSWPGVSEPRRGRRGTSATARRTGAVPVAMLATVRPDGSPRPVAGSSNPVHITTPATSHPGPACRRFPEDPVSAPTRQLARAARSAPARPQPWVRLQT
jgi:hypothetical protein